MARRYALVPESWLGKLNGGAKLETDSENTQSKRSEVKMFSDEKKEQKLVHLADLLPKNMRSRARMLLHYVENGNVTVNDVQRIVYENGTVGSHILDLTRYAISPFVKTRPLDWPQFMDLLERLGVPSSALVSRTVNTVAPQNQILSQWKIY